MDTRLRTLLAASQKHGVKKGQKILQEAYKFMRSVAEAPPNVDAPEPFGQDLFVIGSEIAFQHGDMDMSKEFLKMFFMKRPPTNQFLCRAYLCQAQHLAPASADNPEQLEKAVLYLIKAINMAKENPRYHFLVYNASVLYWQFSRPFLKPSFRQYLAHSLHQVVKALDDIEDSDYEWRAQLMIALIECHMDAGRKSDASHIATAAASFIKQHVPGLYKTLFGLMVMHQLMDAAKLQRDSKSTPELAVYYKLCKLKLSIENHETDKDILEESRRLVALMGGRLTTEDALLTSADSKIRHGSLIQDDRKSVGRKSLQSPSVGEGMKKLPDDSKEKPYLLMELAHLALEQDLPDVANSCVALIHECLELAKDPGLYAELEFMECELSVKRLGDKQESYQSKCVEIRLQAIQRCEEAIHSAVRQGNANVIQAGCVTKWNLCLPLLQPNLHKHVRRPLTTVATVLENINGLLVSLRCQVHTELAKCEEDEEHLELAMQHLKKALSMDDGEVYRERLQVALHRLELRAELYQQPERPEDQAGMIIEQARRADSGTIRMKRSLLVRAGQALAPDAFLLVLDSESDTKEVVTGKGPLTQVKKLAGRAQQFNNAVKKADGHLRRLGDENDRERAALWGDLAKTARKQEVWDVCRVAARFCLLYDDNRWRHASGVRKVSPPVEKNKSEVLPVSSSTDTMDKSHTDLPLKPSMSRVSKADPATSRPDTPVTQVPLYEKDLIRMLAEVHFINGEALIHLLRSEGVELGDLPVPPVDTSKHPKGYIAQKPEEDPDWQEYVTWIKSLSVEAVDNFLRSASLGVELQEAWLVCNAATYVWNYNNHILLQNRHREIMDTLNSLLDSLKKAGHAGEPILLANVCNALASALIKPWEPAPVPKESVLPGQTSPEIRPESSKRKGAPIPATTKSRPAITPVQISTDAMPDLKQAVEVCEYALHATYGNLPGYEIPMSVRQALLKTWVRSKQMLQQQIGKGLGADDETSNDNHNQMIRAVVSVEMLSLNGNGIMEFKDCPPLSSVADMVENCSWTEHQVELALWTRLTFLAFQEKDHGTVSRCAQKALQFAQPGTQPTSKNPDHHTYIVEQELLSYASSLFGQSLIMNTQGKNAVRRQAMLQFLASAQFAKEANNGDLVLQAVRHYWNASLPLINQPIERELVREPLHLLLDCINETTDKNKYRKEDEEEEEVSATPGRGSGALQPISAGQGQESQGQSSHVGGPEDDLTLRASIYGVLFQSYADKGEWENGLKAMDQAISDMPRTKHRLLIFRHLVMVKARLGQNVQMSIQKFKDQSEDSVAHMWHRVALCSKEQLEQLQAYQSAIEALTSPSSDWQKFDYLVEFGQWLYCNDFPSQDALDQLEWAADILMNMKPEVEEKKEPAKPSKKGKGKKEKKETTAAEKPKGKKQTSNSEEGKDIDKTIIKEETSQTDHHRSVSKDNTKIESTQSTDCVPVIKEAVIGVELVSPGLTLQDLVDVCQLEGLMRAHVTMSQVAGRASAQYLPCLLASHAYIMRIWQISVGNSGPVLKELAKKAHEQASDNSGKASPKGKKGKDKDKEPVKEKPKRKGPLDFLPQSTEEWASYDVPDELFEAFKHESMKMCGLNKNTITKPTLTLVYLEQLVKELRSVGYNHLALPVLALADAISRDLIQSRPLTAYIHLKAMEVCVELDLPLAAAFHEKLAVFRINEEEQALSRQEMALWKEQQLQVEREEKQLRATMAKFSAKTSSHSKSVHMVTQGKGSGSGGDSSSTHLGREVGEVKLREVWTDTAELLISQTLYQPARDLLNEANLAAMAFGDKHLHARCIYLLGRLAYAEGQYGQTVKLCQEAQASFNGEEVFWFETTMLMVEATLKDYELKNRISQARALLVHALTVFTDIAELHPNKISINGYILAKLEAKLGMVQAELAFENHNDITEPNVSSALLSACKKLARACDQLIELGYKRETFDIFEKHAGILTRMARAAATPEGKHNFYMQSVHVLWEACHLAEMTLHEVVTLAPIHEVRAVSLPIQREAAYIKLAYSELLIEVLQVHVREEQQRHVQERRKGSVLRAVEALTRDTPDLSSQAKEWDEYTRVVGELSLTQLSAAHSLAGSNAELKAKSLYLIGRCLRLLSTLKNPSLPQHWTAQELEILQITGLADIAEENNKIEEGGEEGEEKPAIVNETAVTSLINHKHTQMMKSLKASSDIAHQYLAQATECLVQAVNLSLAKQLKIVAGLAAQELVECIGQFDAGLATQYLALHQSCAASQYMESLLHRALVDPSVSQQAALFHQISVLQNNGVTSNRNRGPVYKAASDTLKQTSQAWKWLQVLPNHLDILKELPPNFVLVVLQHSPDISRLYGAVLDKPKNTGSGLKPQKGVPAPQTASKAKIVSTDTSPDALNELLERFKSYKHDVMQTLLKFEYQRSQQAQRQKMLANLDGNLKQGTKNTSDEELAEDEARLHEEFLQLLTAMENYLQPITSQLQACLKSDPNPTPIDQKPTRGTESQPILDTVVILADQYLMELPLEALRCLQHENIIGMSRELSLQMLYHKLHVEIQDAAAEKAQKEKDKNKPPSRIPGMRDAAKKQAKIIPLDRPVPAGCIPIDTHAVKYFVDPHLDCSETEEKAPIEVFEAVIEEHEQQFTPRWLGVAGNDHTPSVGEYETYISESSGFIFYGMERFLSYLPPHKAASLSLPDCQLAVLFDLAQTNKSFSRQSKTDVLKTVGHLALEKPVESAVLLGLAGINCVIHNQWHCTLQENAEKVDLTLRDLLAKGLTSGETVRLLFTPYRRVKEEEEATGEKTEQKSEVSQEGEKEEKTEAEGKETIENPESLKTSSWYNTVCYGIPNLMVTQLSKP